MTNKAYPNRKKPRLKKSITSTVTYRTGFSPKINKTIYGQK